MARIGIIWHLPYDWSNQVEGVGSLQPNLEVGTRGREGREGLGVVGVDEASSASPAWCSGADAAIAWYSLV